MDAIFQSFVSLGWWEILVTICNTLITFLIVKKFLFKPVLKMINERQKEIDDMYSAADSAQKQAQAMEAEYQQKLSAAADTGERIVKEAVARGQAREEEILRQANAQAAAILDKASADIAMEKKKAVNDAKDEISDIAMAIAEKVVGRELGDADQSDLINEFINGLGDQV